MGRRWLLSVNHLRRRALLADSREHGPVSTLERKYFNEVSKGETGQSRLAIMFPKASRERSRFSRKKSKISREKSLESREKSSGSREILLISRMFLIWIVGKDKLPS